MDNVLMEFDGWPRRSDPGILKTFCTEVMAHKAIIDTGCRHFGATRKYRPQVRQFIRPLLGKLAKMMRGAVVLLAHPSRSGLASGEGGGAGRPPWRRQRSDRL